jgi:hypothetical protein
MIQMNQTHQTHMNDVKFTGSAFESPGDAATILFQVILLLTIMFGIRVVDN